MDQILGQIVDQILGQIMNQILVQILEAEYHRNLRGWVSLHGGSHNSLEISGDTKKNFVFAQKILVYTWRILEDFIFRKILKPICTEIFLVKTFRIISYYFRGWIFREIKFRTK